MCLHNKLHPVVFRYITKQQIISNMFEKFSVSNKINLIIYDVKAKKSHYRME